VWWFRICGQWEECDVILDYSDSISSQVTRFHFVHKSSHENQREGGGVCAFVLLCVWACACVHSCSTAVVGDPVPIWLL
jgi:hypothetical protein